MATQIFKNDQWILSWANERHHEIRIESRTKAFVDYAIMYPYNKKIAYDYPGSIPTYIKNKVKTAFAKGYGWNVK
ncbi:MAG: hypothetical protein WCX79_00060 [Candidatus Paceibacterota bacterium]|jgi:hypothetical protein